MTIDPWNPACLDDPEASALTPHSIIFTIRLMTFDGDPVNDGRGQLCDLAWTTAAERDRHFWYSSSFMKEDTKLPIVGHLREYLLGHVEEIKGMNPTWSVGRLEFMDRWMKMNGKGVTR